MKYTIVINQVGISEHGLLNETDLKDWVIIEYIKDWQLSGRAKKLILENEEYVWINYAKLIEDLPLLKIGKRDSLTNRFKKLRRLGLLKTFQAKDNTLYCRVTSLAVDVCYSKKSTPTRSKADSLPDQKPTAPTRSKAASTNSNQLSNSNQQNKDCSERQKRSKPPMNGKLDKDLLKILNRHETLKHATTNESFKFWDAILETADLYFKDDASMQRWFTMQLGNIDTWQRNNSHRASHSRKGLERRIGTWLSKEFLKLEGTKR